MTHRVLLTGSRAWTHPALIKKVLEPAECVAFIVGASRGAIHCAAEAEKRGVPTRKFER